MDLPRWTSEHIPQDPSDSSDSDELGDSQDDSTETDQEEMGNNLSSEYDRELVLAALDAIPDMPSKRPTTSPQRPSASGNTHSSPQSAPDESSFESRAMDACTTKDVTESQPEQAETTNTSLTDSLSQDSTSRPLPQEFPLSPPRPSQTLSPLALEHISSDESNDSGMDDLPSVEHLVALTQPKQHENLSQKKTKRQAASSRPHSSNRSLSPRVTIKRQMSDSPRIPSQPPPKKRRKINSKTEPVEYIEILDSSSDEQPLKKIDKNSKTEPLTPAIPSTPSQSQRPTPKPKRKAFSHTTCTPTFTGVPCHQASLSQRRPPKHAKYEKHSVYWHLDGSVRIQIRGICFQLHRSILARQSKYFEDMFADRRAAEIGSSDMEQQLYDISHLEITVEDFEELLCALDDTHACFHGELPFSKLNSLLRASTTLGFTAIEKYASNALSAMWSADLADVGLDKIECPTESLALARQCALFPVIKRTLYELVRLSNFGQVKVMPGDVISAASTVRLAPYDKDILLTAREHLGIAWREALDVDRFPTCVAQQGVVDGTVAPADNTPACAAANRALSLVAHHEIIKEHGILDFEYDPVSGLQVLAAAPWKEKGFCHACVEQRQHYWLKERERIWYKLDEWFEV